MLRTLAKASISRGSHVAISGFTHEITSAPRKIASSAGSTDTATSRIGLANIAEAKKMFMPAGGHRKPISITARKITPKCRVDAVAHRHRQQ